MSNFEIAQRNFEIAQRKTQRKMSSRFLLTPLKDDAKQATFRSAVRPNGCSVLYDRMAARPQLADFLASPRRMPRYARDPSGSSTYLYVAGRASPEILEA